MKLKYILGVILFISVALNVHKFLKIIDLSVGNTYQLKELNDYDRTLRQTFALTLKLQANNNSRLTQQQTLEIFSKNSKYDLYKKDGYFWVGTIGLKFDSKGKMIDIAPFWEPF